MRVADLFSGIGGFSIGLERSGMETVLFCESEDYPVSKLNKHWPHVPVHRDIRTLDGNQYRGTIDLVCGGFPCQPFSTAGKQRGKEDDRYLWPEMLRFIDESKPTWVIGENVAGLVGMGFETVFTKLESQTLTRDENHDYFNSVLTRQETMCLDQICQGLEKIGYEVQPLIIPACAIGAIHRRDRVWIIAYAKSERCREAGSDSRRSSKRTAGSGDSQIGTDTEVCGWHEREFEATQGHQTGMLSGGQDCAGSMADASNNERTRQQRDCNEILSEQKPTRLNEPLLREVTSDTQIERLQRIGDRRNTGKEETSLSWCRSTRGDRTDVFRPVPIPTQCPVRHRDDELPDNVARLKALGNAVMPENAEMIGRAIMQTMRAYQ